MSKKSKTTKTKNEETSDETTDDTPSTSDEMTDDTPSTSDEMSNMIPPIPPLPPELSPLLKTAVVECSQGLTSRLLEGYLNPMILSAIQTGDPKIDVVTVMAAVKAIRIGDLDMEQIAERVDIIATQLKTYIP